MSPDVRGIWSKVVRRCTNPEDDSYPKYGGAGITVHKDYVFDFERFARDLGERPSDEHTVDRIDPTKGYEPGNIRWATKRQQALNCRGWTNASSKFKGVHFIKGRTLTKPWRAMSDVGGKRHIGYFATEEEAAAAYDEHLRKRLRPKDLPFARLNEVEAA